VATVALDSPIGISMGGYSRHPSAQNRGSPFAQSFDASRGVLTLPTARALALGNGATQVVLVRIDTALVTETLQLRAREQLASPSTQLALIATHTHAGPARFFRPATVAGSDNFDVTAVAMDTYDPELEERMAVSIAEAARQALAAMKPVAVGYGEADGSALNSDRRCENDDLYGADFRDPVIRVVRFDEVDAAGNVVAPLAGILDFAVHGTVLDSGNTLLSTEAPGALEAAASRLLGVPLLFAQGSAGDVSPTTGPYQATQALDRFAALGAPQVAEAFAAAAPARAQKSSALQLVTRSISTERAAVGYAPKEFPEFGGIDCGLGESNCKAPGPLFDATSMFCLSLANTGVSSTALSALRVEDVMMVLLPGEPLTAIGAQVREAAAQVDGVKAAFVIGYAQDHNGYLLAEPDYFRGGYEPTVSPWGWRFGDFVVAQAKVLLSTLELPQPPYLAVPGGPLASRRVTEDSASTPAVSASPKDLERLSTAAFHFSGGDPGLGTPRVTLERSDGSGGTFTPADEPLVLREESTPSFLEDPSATTRAHAWSVEWETVPATPPGHYRFVADGVAQLDGQSMTYHLLSDTFALSPSSSAGALVNTVATSSGALGVQLRFPANPVQFSIAGDPVGNYRLRDLDSTAEQGALARGGTASATVTFPDGGQQPVTLDWSADAGALLTPLSAQSGDWAIDLAAGAFTDGDGNRNGAPVHVDVRF
jgi:neutral ceramidase